MQIAVACGDNALKNCPGLSIYVMCWSCYNWNKNENLHEGTTWYSFDFVLFVSVSLEDPKNIRGYGGILGYLRALCSYIARQLSSPIGSEN